MSLRRDVVDAVRQPIFVIGTGRCGSTVFHKILSEHPDVAWLSRVCDGYPTSPWVNRLVMNLLEVPVVSGVVVRRYGPGECYRFWDSYFRGFGTTCRDLVADDVTLKVKRELGVAAANLVTVRRSRLLVKITGWPRIGFLKEIFPDAKFVHVIRDGRAVANSCLTTSFWEGWKGPSVWRWGDMDKHKYEVWERSGKSFLVLAGIEWKTLMEATENASKGLSSNDYLEIKYEDLCQDVVGVTKKVTEFAGLRWDSGFENRINSYRLRNKDYKWHRDLTPVQRDVINDLLKDSLRRYGYWPDESERGGVSERNDATDGASTLGTYA